MNEVTREEFDELKQTVQSIKEQLNAHPYKPISNEERMELINKLLTEFKVQRHIQKLTNPTRRRR
jgi:anaerobic glycerol-3-phosphate dehydrogenase